MKRVNWNFNVEPPLILLESEEIEGYYIVELLQNRKANYLKSEYRKEEPINDIELIEKINSTFESNVKSLIESSFFDDGKNYRIKIKRRLKTKSTCVKFLELRLEYYIDTGRMGVWVMDSTNIITDGQNEWWKIRSKDFNKDKNSKFERFEPDEKTLEMYTGLLKQNKEITLKMKQLGWFNEQIKL